MPQPIWGAADLLFLLHAALKCDCLERLDAVAQAHPAGHLLKVAARYVLRKVGCDRISRSSASILRPPKQQQPFFGARFMPVDDWGGAA